MKSLSNCSHFLKGFSGLFTKPTYHTFKSMVGTMIRKSDYSQANMAAGSGKSTGQIQYFFSRAKWCHKKLNELRLRWMKNKCEFRDRVSDDVILDGSVIKKDKDAKFSGLASFMYSNLSKGVVNGLMLLGASIKTNEGRRYLLDTRLFVEYEWLSEWKAWKDFADHISNLTKGVLFILDRGFRNKYFLAHILKLKRLFLVRVSVSINALISIQNHATQRAGVKRGRQKEFPNRRLVSIRKWINGKKPVQCKEGRLWIIPHALINAWKSEVKQECTVIVFHRNGFRNPLVLVYSVGEVNTDEALRLVGKYISRWSIEILFKELKSWFDFGGFKTTSKDGIYRFLHMTIFTHSLLTVLLEIIHKIPRLKQMIIFVLRKSRNIKELMIIGLKLFFESVLSICLTPPKWLTLNTKRTLIAYFL